MLRNLLTIILIASATTLSAQSVLRSGLEVGLTTSFYDNNYSYENRGVTYWNKSSPVIGPVIGYHYMLELPRRFSVRAGLQYQLTGMNADRGHKEEVEPGVKLEEVPDYFNHTHSLRLHKWALPVAVGYKWIDRGQFSISTSMGLRLNYIFHARFKSQDVYNGEQYGGVKIEFNENYNPLREDQTYSALRPWALQGFFEHSATIKDQFIVTARVNGGGSIAWNQMNYGWICILPEDYYDNMFNHSDFTLSFTWLFER